MKRTLFTAIMSLCCYAMAADMKDDVLLRSMREELDRSYAALKSAETVPLYYIGYEVYDKQSYSISGGAGAISRRGESRSRALNVDVRVGDNKLDNTHELKGREADNSKDIGSIALPVEDDAAAIKARIWELTDPAYKDALNQYAKVKMNKSVTAEEEDKSDDFSQASQGAQYYEKETFPQVDKAHFEGMMVRLSGKFKKYDFIYDSWVNMGVETINKYMVNSEGANIVAGNTYTRLAYYLFTRTKDGMDLYRYKSYEAKTPDGLPSEQQISADIDISIAELKALKDAPIAEPYSGPAILDGIAASVFFHEIFGHRIEGHRQKSESEGQTFSKKVGQPIMPAFISVYDDPKIKTMAGKFLNGHYEFDDEATPAGKAVLVENGVLKGFLMNRTPIKGFPASNGHGRRSEGRRTVARQGNLIVESSKKVPYQELRRMLIEEVKKSGKPYGLVIKDIQGGFTITGRGLPQSFTVNVLLADKVYPDGRPDEIVRGLNIIGTPIQTFPKIKMAADDTGVFNGTCGAESGWVPVSGVSPSLLFSDFETEKVAKSNNKPPVLKPPYSDR